MLLREHGWLPADGEEADLTWWTDHGPSATTFRPPSPHQCLNRFPNHTSFTQKSNLAAIVQQARRRRDGASMDFFPETYRLPEQEEELRTARSKAPEHTLWILKPPSGSQGKRIRVIANHEPIPPGHYIVCRYLRRPLLINGLKHDLRLYVLVTSWYPLIVYLHDEGLVRFATTPYRTNAARRAYRRTARGRVAPLVLAHADPSPGLRPLAREGSE